MTKKLDKAGADKTRKHILPSAGLTSNQSAGIARAEAAGQVPGPYFGPSRGELH